MIADSAKIKVCDDVDFVYGWQRRILVQEDTSKVFLYFTSKVFLCISFVKDLIYLILWKFYESIPFICEISLSSKVLYFALSFIIIEYIYFGLMIFKENLYGLVDRFQLYIVTFLFGQDNYCLLSFLMHVAGVYTQI